MFALALLPPGWTRTCCLNLCTSLRIIRFISWMSSTTSKWKSNGVGHVGSSLASWTPEGDDGDAMSRLLMRCDCMPYCVRRWMKWLSYPRGWSHITWPAVSLFSGWKMLDGGVERFCKADGNKPREHTVIDLGKFRKFRRNAPPERCVSEL